MLRKLAVAESNYAASLNGLSQAVSSPDDSVTITLERSDGETETVSVPSFHYLEAAIKRLDANLDSMANVSAGSSAVRLSDGTYRRLMTVKLPAEAASIVTMPTANSFYIRSNYFFENMINPLLCTSFDVTGQVSSGVKQVLSRRYILGIDNPVKKAYFDTYLKGRSDISFTDFLTALGRHNISYVLDEEVKDMPLKSKRYSGEFSVMNIFNATEDGVTRKFVRLDKLTYTDTMSDYTDTMQLAVGDVLEVAQGTLDTRYKITHIDTSANTVVLELLEGFKPVRVADGYFRLSADTSQTVSVEVTVGFGEYTVVFLKPADEASGILAADWSPGTAFFTNDLTMTADNGDVITLQQFYMKNCADFGAFLLSYQNDSYPTSSQAITPDAPVINADDMQVVQINTQVTDNDDIRRIKQISAEKTSLSAEITAKSNAITALKTRINSTVYATEQAQAADRSQLQDLVNEYNALVTEFSAKVSTIASLAQSSSVASATPKYRVRGFFAIPAEKVSPATGTQAIIKFITRYKYLNLDGNANAVQEIGDEVSGSFSNWTMVESVLRPRVRGTDGVFRWKETDTQDTQEINMNQIDIPITKGETVEFQVRSVSEAGYPANPAMSDWSEPVRITFPEELSVNSPAEDIIDQNTRDSAQMLINNTLVTRGLISHIADSFTANNITFTHSAHTLFSGFKSEDQQPIDLFTKLNDMQTSINNLLELVNGTLGTMSVDVTDEVGNAYPLTEDTLTTVYAGSYVSAIAGETVKRGSIMTKTFWINIRNSAQSGLRLFSTLTGARNRIMPIDDAMAPANSEIWAPPFFNRTENENTINEHEGYKTYKSYGNVPINQNSGDAFSMDGILNAPDGYQSAQCRNQYIAFRIKDCSGSLSFYLDTPTATVATSGSTSEIDLEKEEFLVTPESPAAIDVSDGMYDKIWDSDSGFDTNGAPRIKHETTDFCVHIDHPYIKNQDEWLSALSRLTGCSVSSSDPVYADGFNKDNNKHLFMLPKYLVAYGSASPEANTAVMAATQATGNIINTSFNKKVVATTSIAAMKYYRQVGYAAGVKGLVLYDSGNSASLLKYIAGTHRIGYTSTDKYLIGKNTCGCYLYPDINTRDAMQVNGDSYNSSAVVAGESTISIPLVFQARMTDYYGVADSDTGRLMGDATISSGDSLRIANRLGFDIGVGKNSVKSFDIEIYATYMDSGVVSPNTRLSTNAVATASASTAVKASKLASGSNVTAVAGATGYTAG